MTLEEAKRILEDVLPFVPPHAHEAVKYAIGVLDEVKDMRGWLNPSDEKRVSDLPFHTLTELDIPFFLWGDNIIETEE